MITLLSCMCYYHSCVQYLKLIVLYWNFLLLCVWTDICTLYLFYVSEINIYYYYYYRWDHSVLELEPATWASITSELKRDYARDLRLC